MFMFLVFFIDNYVMNRVVYDYFFLNYPDYLNFVKKSLKSLTNYFNQNRI